MTTEKPKKKTFNWPGCIFISGLGMVIFFTILTLGLISDEGAPGDIRFSTVLLFVGIVLTLSGAVLWYMRYRIGTPEITVSATTLRIGDPFTLTYRHPVRSSVTIDEIQVALVFREKATYQQGTDTRTVTHNHIIDPREIPAGAFQRGQVIEQMFEMQIPADAMHSLDVRRNKLEWLITVQLTIPRTPDIKQEYELTVLPEIAR